MWVLGIKPWLSGLVASAFLSRASPGLGLLSNVGAVKIMGILGDELSTVCFTKKTHGFAEDHSGCYKQLHLDVRLTKGPVMAILLLT